MKKRLIIAGLVILAVAAGGGGYYYYKKGQAAEKQGMPVEAVTVEKKSVEAFVTSKGRVELLKNETVAAEAQAKILNVNVKVGDTVNEGDVLIEYDPKSMEAIEESLVEARLTLRSAELALEGASLPASAREIANAELEIEAREKAIKDVEIAIEKAELTTQGALDSLETAQKDLEIKRTLYNAGVISRAELDITENRIPELELSVQSSRMQREALENDLTSAQRYKDAAVQALEALNNRASEPSVINQIEMAQITVEQQRLRIEQLEKQLSEFKLFEVSPISGDVISVLVENGYVTKAGDRLINLGDTSELIIVTEVVEYDVPNISAGQSVELTGEALRDNRLMGEVISVAPAAVSKQIENTTGNVVRTEIGLVEENTVLRPGFSVTAKILTASYEDATVVPLLSLMYDKDGEYSVFVIGADNTLERRKVSVVNFAALEAVVEGVDEGETIVASPSYDLEEGTLVSVNQTDDTSAAGNAND